MSGSLNRASLIGHLGAKPEVRTGQGGGRVVTFSLATSERWTDERTGERQERTEWHRVVIFNLKLGELGEKYLDKGSKVFIEGIIRTRKWQDKDGARPLLDGNSASDFQRDADLPRPEARRRGRSATRGAAAASRPRRNRRRPRAAARKPRHKPEKAPPAQAGGAIARPFNHEPRRKGALQ